MDAARLKPPPVSAFSAEVLKQKLAQIEADGGSAIAALEVLAENERRTQIDEFRFANWVIELESEGSPEALIAVRQAKIERGYPVTEAEVSAAEPNAEAQLSLFDQASIALGVEPAVSVSVVVPELAEPEVDSEDVRDEEADSPPASTDANGTQSQSEEPADDLSPDFETRVKSPEVPSFELNDQALEAELEFSGTKFASDENSDSAEALNTPTPYWDGELPKTAADLEAALDLDSAKQESTSFEEVVFSSSVDSAEQEITDIEEHLPGQASSIAAIRPERTRAGLLGRGFEPVSSDSVPAFMRRSRPVSQFFSWLPVGASLLPVLLSLFFAQQGFSLASSVFAQTLGLLVSALVVILGSVAAKRSGLPALVLTRAAFGVNGNLIPGAILLILRFILLVGLAALVAFTLGIAQPLGSSPLGSIEALNNLDVGYELLPVLVVSVLALLIALYGGSVLYRAQVALGLVGAIILIIFLLASVTAIQLGQLNLGTLDDLPAAVAGSALVFSFYGAIWSASGADFARKLPSSASGLKVALWGLLSLAAVPLAVAIYSSVLFSQFAPEQLRLADLAAGRLSAVPQWLSLVMTLGVIIALVGWLAMALYSFNFSLHATWIKLHPAVSQPILGGIVALLTVSLLAIFGSGPVLGGLADYAVFVAVPTAAWAGIYAADVALRRVAYHEVSLTRAYGFYKSFNWTNISGFALATILGWGLISATPSELSWVGYFTRYFGEDLWSTSDIGVWIALVIAGLFPVLFGIPRIRRQEREVLNIEARRHALTEISNVVI